MGYFYNFYTYNIICIRITYALSRRRNVCRSWCEVFYCVKLPSLNVHFVVVVFLVYVFYCFLFLLILIVYKYLCDKFKLCKCIGVLFFSPEWFFCCKLRSEIKFTKRCIVLRGSEILPRSVYGLVPLFLARVKYRFEIGSNTNTHILLYGVFSNSVFRFVIHICEV